MTIPNEVKEIILQYHGSIVEYSKRRRLHTDLYNHFAVKLWRKVNEEFMFIFYPGFYSDLQVAVMPYSDEGDEGDSDMEPEWWP